MSSLHSLSVVMFLSLFSPIAAYAQITPSQDAYTDSSKPTINFGAATTLGVASTVPSIQTSYIQFDLSSIPAGYTSAYVAKATLKLYVNTVSAAGSFNVDFVNGTWSEKTITFNNVPALGSTIVSMVSLASANKNSYLLVDITSALGAWLDGTQTNDGIALVANSQLSSSFDSNENTAQSHPAELDIVFNGAITGINTASGSGLTGGGNTGTLNLSLQKSCGSSQVLLWNGSGWVCSSAGTGTITSVTPGTDLTGGGNSGNVTLNLDATKVPQLSTANTFTGNNSFNGPIGIGSGERLTDGNPYVNLFAGGNTSGGIHLFRNDGKGLGYFYSDSGGIGVLNSLGQWAIRATGAFNTTNSDVSFFTDNGTLRGYLNSTGLTLTATNPAITSGSSYIVIPNGMYLSGGTGYFQNQAQLRGGVNNDQGTLTLSASNNIVNSNATYFQTSGKFAIDASDAWLRLNQQGSFSNGIYTPGFLRADGGIASGGVASLGGGTINASSQVSAGTVVAVNSNSKGIAMLGTGITSSNTAKGIAGCCPLGVWGDTGSSAGGAAGLIGTADDARAIFLQNNSPSGVPTVYAFNTQTSKHGLTVFYTGGSFGSCHIDTDGNFGCTGTKSAVVPVDNGARKVALYAVEAPENWFEDFGSARLSGGVTAVRLDPTFAQTVNTDAGYHVFLTPKGDCKGLYVTDETADGFEVRELGGGSSNVVFDYRIVAHRKGYENIRLADIANGVTPTPQPTQVEHARQRRSE